MARDLDIVVFGATGFTGRLCALYLATKEDVKWAIAGRSRDKLERIAAEVGHPDVIVADSSNEEQLREMALRTKVVMSLVGPYALYGEPLVRVCAQSGTSYTDLTGEMPWVRKMIERYDKDAKESGALIIPSCGFDCVPSDLTAFLCMQKLQAPASARVFLKMKGGVSGGTIASVVAMMDSQPGAPDQNALVLDAPAPEHPDGAPLRTSTFDGENYYGAFAIMASVNAAVVQRTVALLGAPRLEWREYMRVKGVFSGLLMSFASYLVVAVLATPLRHLVARMIPPGTGPSEETQRNGRFEIVAHATSEEQKEVLVTMKGRCDPGYSGTAKMITETAVAVAQGAAHGKTGFQTTGSALGLELVKRLESTGYFTFETREPGHRER